MLKRGINQRAPKIGPTASVTVLRLDEMCVSTSARMSSKARLITLDSERPASVRETVRVLRTNSKHPQSNSNWRIWLLTLVGVTRSSSAAALKLSSRAAASKERRAVSGKRCWEIFIIPAV